MTKGWRWEKPLVFGVFHGRGAFSQSGGDRFENNARRRRWSTSFLSLEGPRHLRGMPPRQGPPFLFAPQTEGKREREIRTYVPGTSREINGQRSFSNFFPPSTLEQLTYSLIHFVIKFETKIRSSEMHREIRRSIRIGDRQSRSSYVAKIFVDEKLRSKRNGRSKEFAFTRSSCITDRRADDRSAWFFCLQIARSSFYSWQRGNERDRPRGAPRIWNDFGPGRSTTGSRAEDRSVREPVYRPLGGGLVTSYIVKKTSFHAKPFTRSLLSLIPRGFPSLRIHPGLFTT